MNASPFHGQVALVTGAGSGIGQAIALDLAQRGACVGLVGRREEPLTASVQAMGEAVDRARVYPSDLARDDEIERLRQAILDEFARLDILVHSAGMYSMGETEVAPVEHFDLQYRSNLRAPYRLTQALLPTITASSGQVVFINSMAGLSASAGVGQYAATKYGLRAVAESLRAELNPSGVRVLSVYPGRTATPMQEQVHASEGRAYRAERLLQPSDVATMVNTALSLPRTAEVTELTIRPMVKAS